MKTIIKIILTISFLFSFTFIKALDTDITLSSEVTKINLEDSFNVNISLNLSGTTEVWEKTIEGIDKFYKLWESNSYRFESINWVNKWVYDILLVLKPKKVWIFIIWPVSLKLWDKTLLSNTIEIEVLWQQSKISQTEDKELTIDDINDIKRPKNTFKLSYWFLLVFLGILFFIGFYYLLRYYFDLKEKEAKNKINADNEIISKNKYFLDKLDKLRVDSDSYNKSEFYSLINDFLREFLEFKGLSYARNMTFKELERSKKLIDKDLFEIIKDTYFEEFKKEDSDINRIEIIDKIKSKI